MIVCYRVYSSSFKENIYEKINNGFNDVYWWSCHGRNFNDL